MTGEDLRALSAAATPGPWRAYKYGVIGSGDLRNGDVCGDYQDDMRWDDKALIVWLRNHADAIADLIDAASDHHHTECLLHDTRWGGVDTCDNLGVTPADSRRCPNCRLRDALAALEAAPARLAEVTAERDRLAAAIKAIPRHRRGNDPCTYGACMVCAAPWPCPTENVRAALAALDADA